MMEKKLDYLSINKNSWNKRTDPHIESEFYDNINFIKGQSSLNEFELNLLGDVKGKRILHLQCHFGQDTISLARLGAKVTGIDLSDKAIKRAKELAKKTKIEASFICCDVYNLPKVLKGQFDIVFTSYGTIIWLPDLLKWGAIISNYLKPQGMFVFVEFHPVIWMFDDNFKEIKYNYLITEPIIESEQGSYASEDNEMELQNVTWNHGIGEVVNALIRNNIAIQSLEEFDYSPYNCFNETIEFEPKKYRIKHLENRIPMVYAIKGIKL